MFWDRLGGMPYVEAIEELNSRRMQLIEEKAEAETGKVLLGVWDVPAEKDRTAQLTRVNTELKRLNGLFNRLQWKDAVIAIFGRDGYAQCAEWIASRDGRA